MFCLYESIFLLTRLEKLHRFHGRVTPLNKWVTIFTDPSWNPSYIILWCPGGFMVDSWKKSCEDIINSVIQMNKLKFILASQGKWHRRISNHLHKKPNEIKFWFWIVIVSNKSYHNMVKKYCIHMYTTLFVTWETVKPCMRSRISSMRCSLAQCMCILSDQCAILVNTVFNASW